MKKTLLALSLLISFQPLYAENTSSHNKIASPHNAHFIIGKHTTTEMLLTNESKNIKAIYAKNPELVITNKRLKGDLEMENIILENFISKYFSKSSEFEASEYNKLMNGYFVDALKSGHKKLADAILFDSGAIIDLNYMSDNPLNTPLMAVATSLAYDGGDIEYFIKLIKMGADYTLMTTNNNVPLMSLAASVDNYKIVMYLAMLGENPMHVDGFDYYPLDYAYKNNANKTVIILSSIILEYQKVKVNKLAE